MKKRTAKKFADVATQEEWNDNIKIALKEENS
jgi:hypothetical protein